jgi:hypothetical protein
LILDIKSKLDLEEPTNKKESESSIIYLTAFGELMLNKATSISTILANKAFSYLLILEDITSNIRKNFVSKEFKEYTNTIGIRTKVILVETYNSISIIERYYSPL